MLPKRWTHGFLLVAALGLLAAAWKWTGLAAWADPNRMSALFEPLATHWYGIFVVVAVFVVAELFVFPVMVLVFVCGIAFGPVLGPIYALAGSLASAIPPFLLGRKLGRARVERMGGSLVRKVASALEKRGVIAIFLVRKVPAPYTLVNLVCGASPVTMRDFLIGTLLGMGTGVLLLTVLGSQILDLLRDPRPLPILGAIALLLAPLLLAVGTQRKFDRKLASDPKAVDEESKRFEALTKRLATIDPILRPGENCWRIERADRLRCIQDADAYFRLARKSILAAKHSVFILGWDVYANLDLAPGGADDGAPTKLADVLDFAVRRNPKLEIYVLIWDYAALYVLERDPLSRIRLGSQTHERVHFRYDDLHPVAGCHHQKVVVVDDQLAFSGGIDLTSHRWDTADHRVDEPSRVGVTGEPYTPYHDVHTMVEGPIAVALGELARERWRRLGESDLPSVAPSAESVWPDELVDFEHVDVAIALTDPPFRGREGRRECETLFFDEIAAARHVIYIEQQYFTKASIGEALAKRLREPAGPEVVLVLPRDCEGWLEQKTMGALRHQVFASLFEADLHKRLRLLYPLASKARNVSTFVHTKLLVVDDLHLRIGSANLSSRSLGMDSECDLVVAGAGDARVRARIAAVRDRLIAEHFGLAGEAVTAAVAHHGSLRAALDALATGDRRLAPLEFDPTARPETWDALGFAIDPGEPMALSRTIDRLQPALALDDARKAARIAFVIACAAGVFAMGLRGASGAATLDPESVQDFLLKVSSDDGAEPWMFLALIAGGLLFLPFELLVLVSVVLLDPVRGSALAVAAGIVCATIGYLVGRLLGPERILPLMADRARNVWKGLSRYGALSVAIVRFVALFSATSIHVLCGAARVGLRDFALGSLLGLAPALLASIALGALLRQTILHPSPARSLVTISVAFVLAMIVLRLRRIVLMGAHGRALREHRYRARHG
ncbi:MAG TPA: VTT domain-containing protein [Planctomycetota bacterium]|nr:VTT domain-containing protein [Planctomycetota bacterium]